MAEAERYPLGIKPKRIHNQERAIALTEAIHRYLCANEDVPREWISELEELIYPLTNKGFNADIVNNSGKPVIL